MADFSTPGQFEYEGVLVPSLSSAKLIDGARKLTMTPNDTIVATYTKSGTTWMKYLAYLVMHDGQEDPGVNVMLDVPYLEMKLPHETEDIVLKRLAKIPSPRLFVTHLHYRFLKKQIVDDKAKAIVVMRNPKDTLVSFYHFYVMNKALGSYSGTWGEFFQLYQKKKIVNGDIFDYNIEWWNVRDYENVLVVFYEEMKADLEGVVRKVAKFMGYQLSDDVIQKIVHLSSFKQMKGNSSINAEGLDKMGLFDFEKSKFMRKGEVGDWKNYFTEEQSKYIDKMCEEKYKPLGLPVHFQEQ